MNIQKCILALSALLVLGAGQMQAMPKWINQLINPATTLYALGASITAASLRHGLEVYHSQPHAFKSEYNSLKIANNLCSVKQSKTCKHTQCKTNNLTYEQFHKNRIYRETFGSIISGLLGITISAIGLYDLMHQKR